MLYSDKKVLNRNFKNLYCILLFSLGMLSSVASFAQDKEILRTTAGKIKDSALGELSGLVASRTHKGMFWTHNDSGDLARIFLLDAQAKLRATFNLEGIDALDMEDIAWHTVGDKNYLLLGDIGDNLKKRKSIKLYCFEEPTLEGGQSSYTIPAAGIRTITLGYPDKPRDAEAFFIDPVDKQLYLISKRDFHAQVFTAPIFDGKASSAYVLENIGSLPFTFVTAADISATGDAVLMKNLTQIYYWQRPPNTSLKSLFRQEYKLLPYIPEPQGEAICFARQGPYFFTVSERPLGLDAYLYHYQLAPNF